VFDACESKNQTPWNFGIMPYQAGAVFLRKNKAKVSNPPMTVSFEHVTGDKAFVEFVLGEREAPDEKSRELARLLALERALPYWIGLLRSEADSVRRKAVLRVEALTDQVVRLEEEAPKPVEAEDVKRWIGELDDDDFKKREGATKKLMAAGEEARTALTKALEGGSMEQRIRARRILGSLGAKISIQHEVEYARLMGWFETHRDALVWDEKTKKYVRKR
jgi:hypothetical protein